MCLKKFTTHLQKNHRKFKLRVKKSAKKINLKTSSHILRKQKENTYICGQMKSQFACPIIQIIFTETTCSCKK